MTTTNSIILRGTLVGLAAAAAAPLVAQTPTPEIIACYDAKTNSAGKPQGSGIVYRIQALGVVAQQGCVDPDDVQFSWTTRHGALTGLDADDHPQYLKDGEPAGGDLAGAYPNPTVAGLQTRPVTADAPLAGQVLTWNGTAWAPIAPAGGATGTPDNVAGTLVQRDATTSGFAAGPVTLDGGFLARGVTGGAIPATGPGARLMWHPGKAAFRAGQVFDTQWDDANVGDNSTAMGAQTTASGVVSTAMGGGTRATGDASTAMGAGTTASGFNSTALGNRTQASGGTSTAMGDFSVASGQTSTAMGTLTRAVGANSTAMGNGSFAIGEASTAMGSNTRASGDFTTAMGRRASTNDQVGSFVYGDNSSTTNVLATAPNQFVVRAAGGSVFYSNSGLTAGVSLAPGGGGWLSVSDVNRKEHFREVDGEDVLSEVARMPIREWSYKAQDASIRHLGPTAQDFRAAFGLGESDTTITTTDIDGINLLAVQALERRTRDQAREIELLRAELAALRAEMAHRKP